MPFGVMRRLLAGVIEDYSTGHAVKRLACCEQEHLFFHHGNRAVYVLGPSSARRVLAIVWKLSGSMGSALRRVGTNWVLIMLNSSVRHAGRLLPDSAIGDSVAGR